MAEGGNKTSEGAEIERETGMLGRSIDMHTRDRARCRPMERDIR